MNIKTNYSYKELWLITYPILISLAMEQLIGMTDTAFLGRVGEIELGASALAGVYYMIIFMIAFGFSIGAQILIGRRNGEKQYKEIGSIFYQSILFLMVLAVILFTASRTLSPYVLKNVIESEDIYHATLAYINWRVFGFFFSFIAVMFRAFYVGTTQTKTLTLNSVVMVISNIVFNYLLIFGKLGFPALGIAGAAIGSSLAELVSVIFFVTYTFRKMNYKKYGLNKFSGIQFSILKRILNVSLWTMIQNFFSMSTWFMFFLAVEHLGERSLAISNIIRNVSALPFMVLIAYASTASTLISNLIGSGNIQHIWGVIRKTISMSYITIIPLVALFALFPSIILRIYTNNPELITASTPSLWVLCTAYLLLIPANVLFQAVSGTGNTKAALILEFGTLIIYVLYMFYVIIYLKVDVALCWTTEHVYALFMTLFCWLYLKKGNWQNKRI